MYRSSALHSTGGCDGDAAASASSYHTAPGNRSWPEPSSTWRMTRSVRELGQQFGEHRRELGVHDDRRRLRVAQQVQQLVGDVAVVDVERSDSRLAARRACIRGTRCRCGGRSRGGPGRTRVLRAPTARRGSRGPRPTRWLASRRVRSVTCAHVNRRSRNTRHSSSGRVAAIASCTSARLSRTGADTRGNLERVSESPTNQALRRDDP